MIVPAPSRAPARSFHLVQVSYDESILESGSKSDTLARQSQYARELGTLSPGARVTVVVLTFDPSARPFEHGGVSYLPVPYRRRFQIPFRLFRALDRLHAGDPVDVVTTQSVQEDGLAAVIFRKLRGIPAVGQIHIDIFHPAARRENFGSAPWRWVMGPVAFWTLRRYDALRVVGSRIRRSLEARKVPSRVHLIPVAMPLMAEPYEGDPVPEHKVVFVGRLEDQKRLDLWLDVAAILAERDPSLRFELAGEGTRRGELERRARELGIADKVKFLGLVPYGDLPRLYASSKAFLITSSYEGFGRVVAEAMHFKVPVVAFRITGIEDIVEDGKTGFLHPFGDIAGMAESVLRLTGDEGLRRSMGAAARDSVDAAFHPGRLAREWMALLHATTRPGVSADGILPPRRPTFRRWRALSSSKYTLLRALEYEALHGLRLEGRTLDVGGGEVNSYYSILDFRGPVESANIDPGMRPTHLADLNQPLALPSEAYDTVISLNTFEHLFHDQIAIEEALRVLRPGGRFHITVPFLYRVHGSPSDHHRHTAFWWREHLLSLGLRPGAFTVEPLVWSPLSSALALIEFGRRGWLRKLAMLPPLLSLRHGRLERLPHRRFDDFALGYYITGTK